MTAGVAPSQSPTKPARLGLFEIRGRITEPAPPAGRIVLRVSGTADGSFAGRDGIATCIAKPADEAALAKLTTKLDSLKALRHPNLQPVLDAGVAGNVLYWVSIKPAIPSLAESAGNTTMTPLSTRQLVREIGGALSTMHAAQLTHGAVGPATIVPRPDNVFMLCGLGLSGRRQHDDQRDLALTVIALLKGSAWSPSQPAEHSAAHADALRSFLETITARLVTVLARASDPQPESQYPTVAAFVDDYELAIAGSAEDLAHGAFEAISSNSPEIADLLYQRARQYDPACELLTVLGIQLHGGSLFESASSQASMVQIPDMMQAQAMMPTAMPAPAPKVDPVSLIPADLAAGLPQEYLESVAQQFVVEPVKPPRFNPMFLLILGGLGMVIVLLLAVLITWSAS